MGSQTGPRSLVLSYLGRTPSRDVMESYYVSFYLRPLPFPRPAAGGLGTRLVFPKCRTKLFENLVRVEYL